MSDNPKEAAPYSGESRLEKPIQEHIGKELRSFYNVMADEPAYLGDPTLPPELQTKLLQLSPRLNAIQRVAEAVKEALEIEQGDTADKDHGGG